MTKLQKLKWKAVAEVLEAVQEAGWAANVPAAVSAEVAEGKAWATILRAAKAENI